MNASVQLILLCMSSSIICRLLLSTVHVNYEVGVLFTTLTGPILGIAASMLYPTKRPEYT